jgi:hypothetical protein
VAECGRWPCVLSLAAGGSWVVVVAGLLCRSLLGGVFGDAGDVQPTRVMLSAIAGARYFRIVLRIHPQRLRQLNLGTACMPVGEQLGQLVEKHTNMRF